MPSVKDILSFVRKKVVKDQKGKKISQEDLVDRLGFEVGAYRTYESGRSQPSVEFCEAYKTILGIDLFASTKGKLIVIVDPTRYTPEQLLLFKKKGVDIINIPIFNPTTLILPFPSQVNFEKPVLLVPQNLCSAAEFGIEIVDDSMGPGYLAGDYVYCGKLLAANDILPGHTYLLSVANGKTHTLKILKAEADSNPVAFSGDAVRGIYKVVGHHKGEAGINQ